MYVLKKGDISSLIKRFFIVTSTCFITGLNDILCLQMLFESITVLFYGNKLYFEKKVALIVYYGCMAYNYFTQRYLVDNVLWSEQGSVGVGILV